jgi:hypothetical protein
MIEDASAQEVPLGDEIVEAEMVCRRALDADYPSLIHREAPRNPEGWFELLCGIPYDRTRVAALRRLKADAERIGLCSPYAVERFAVLQAYLVALPRLRSLPVDESVNRQFCATCRQLAFGSQTRGSQTGESRLALGSDAFAELAQIVTFRRFHAGQLSFDIMKMPIGWLLKVHSIELPGLIRELISGIGGVGPMVAPHVNYWRSNPLVILKREQERALWRIGRSIERDYRIKGLIASSWLYSVMVGQSSPHLAWVRDFFINHNAYVLDLGPALADSGFLVGSEKRRRLYADGDVRPRETLVLWRREDMIAWTKSQTEFGDTACPRYVPHADARATKRLPANPKLRTDRTLRSGQLTLIDCKRWLHYKPKSYIMIIVLFPALCAAIVATIIWSAGAGCVSFIFAFAVMWLSQYFFLQ